MKKPLTFLSAILAGLIAGVLITSALTAITGFSLFGESRDNRPPLDEPHGANLTAFAFDILEQIKDGDYHALSLVAHPELGVLFSPCATISLQTNKCFLPEQIAAFDTDSNEYVWGVYSISGEPIEMTPSEYFAEFVFARDYTAASVIGVNHVVRSGNALENITDELPGILFVDFHIPGDDKDASEEPDWSSLRLGFEEYDGDYRLTVILHSERTV